LTIALFGHPPRPSNALIHLEIRHHRVRVPVVQGKIRIVLPEGFGDNGGIPTETAIRPSKSSKSRRSRRR